jgi:FkbM family methyltransferase
MLGAARFLLKEIYTKKRYYRKGFKIRPNDTIVDIGANIGIFVLWAAPQAPKGRIVAVEPTSVIKCLEDNLRLNKITNVTPLQAAVGREGKMLEFVEYPGFNIVNHQRGMRPAWVTRMLINLIYKGYKKKKTRVTARCKSLRNIMDEFKLDTVDLLKIDCEGGEYEMFRSLSTDH